MTPAHPPTEVEKNRFVRGRKKTGGRRKGTPNKATNDVREAIALLTQRNVLKLDKWLNAIKEPERKIALFIDLAEFTIPKLARTEITGAGGGAVILKLESLDEAL